MTIKSADIDRTRGQVQSFMSNVTLLGFNCTRLFAPASTFLFDKIVSLIGDTRTSHGGFYKIISEEIAVTSESCFLENSCWNVRGFFIRIIGKVHVKKLFHNGVFRNILKDYL